MGMKVRGGAREWPEWRPLREMDPEWVARNFGLHAVCLVEEDVRSMRAEGGEDASWIAAGWYVCRAGDAVWDCDICVGPVEFERLAEAWDDAQDLLDDGESEEARGAQAAREHRETYRRAREFHSRLAAL